MVAHTADYVAVAVVVPLLLFLRPQADSLSFTCELGRPSYLLSAGTLLKNIETCRRIADVLFAAYELAGSNCSPVVCLLHALIGSRIYFSLNS